MPMVVIKTCQRLGVHEEALKMVMQPVKYGLFPMRKAMKELINCCDVKGDVQGMSDSHDHVGRVFYM